MQEPLVAEPLLDGRDDAVLDLLADLPGLCVLVLIHDESRSHYYKRDVLGRLLGGVGHELERAQDRPVEIDVEHLLIEHHRAEVDRGHVVEADGVPLALGEQVFVVLEALGQVLLGGDLELRRQQAVLEVRHHLAELALGLVLPEGRVVGGAGGDRNQGQRDEQHRHYRESGERFHGTPPYPGGCGGRRHTTACVVIND